MRWIGLTAAIAVAGCAGDPTVGGVVIVHLGAGTTAQSHFESLEISLQVAQPPGNILAPPDRQPIVPGSPLPGFSFDGLVAFQEAEFTIEIATIEGVILRAQRRELAAPDMAVSMSDQDIVLLRDRDGDSASDFLEIVANIDPQSPGTLPPLLNVTVTSGPGAELPSSSTSFSFEVTWTRPDGNTPGSATFEWRDNGMLIGGATTNPMSYTGDFSPMNLGQHTIEATVIEDAIGLTGSASVTFDLCSSAGDPCLDNDMHCCGSMQCSTDVCASFDVREGWIIYTGVVFGDISGIAIDDSGVQWAVNRAGELLRNNGGWTIPSNSGGKVIEAVAPVPSGISGFAVELVVVGADETIWTVNSATTFNAVYSGTTSQTLRAVAVDPDGKVWAAGDAGTVIEKPVSGAAIPRTASGSTLRAIWSAPGGTDVWIGGGNNLARWDGASFNLVNVPGTLTNITAIAGSGGTVYIAQFGNPGLYSTPIAAPDVQAVSDLSTNAPMQALAIDGNGNVWAAGEGGSIAHFDGGVWTEGQINNAPLQFDLTAIARDTGEVLVGGFGSVFGGLDPP